ncbi:hypothetical protein RB195_006634 [Necator americanus]|uniref:Uncharacterized protein n=1 Tax=Necator americanus TaxID=51031 RepID=A0ABR1BXC5_NECAM
MVVEDKSEPPTGENEDDDDEGVLGWLARAVSCPQVKTICSTARMMNDAKLWRTTVGDESQSSHTTVAAPPSTSSVDQDISKCKQNKHALRVSWEDGTA